VAGSLEFGTFISPRGSFARPEATGLGKDGRLPFCVSKDDEEYVDLKSGLPTIGGCFGLVGCLGIDNEDAWIVVLSETDGSIEHVGVNNATSTGFVLTWAAPKKKFKHFVITQTELGPENKEKDEMEKDEETNGEEEVDDGTGLKTTAAKKNSLRKGKAELVPNVQRTKMNKSGGNLTTVLPGSARSYQMTNLSPQTRYSVSIFGKGPAFRSKTHNLVIHTGTQNQKSVLLNLNL